MIYARINDKRLCSCSPKIKCSNKSKDCKKLVECKQCGGDGWLDQVDQRKCQECNGKGSIVSDK